MAKDKNPVQSNDTGPTAKQKLKALRRSRGREDAIDINKLIAPSGKDADKFDKKIDKLRARVIKSVKQSLPNRVIRMNNIRFSEVIESADSKTSLRDQFVFSRIKSKMLKQVRKALPKGAITMQALRFNDILDSDGVESNNIVRKFRRVKRKLLNSVRRAIPNQFKELSADNVVGDILGETPASSMWSRWKLRGIRSRLIKQLRRTIPSTVPENDLSISNILGEGPQLGFFHRQKFAKIKSKLLKTIYKSIPQMEAGTDNDLSISNILGEGPQLGFFHRQKFAKIKSKLLNVISKSIPNLTDVDNDISVSSILGESPANSEKFIKTFDKIRLKLLKNLGSALSSKDVLENLVSATTINVDASDDSSSGGTELNNNILDKLTSIDTNISRFVNNIMNNDMKVEENRRERVKLMTRQLTALQSLDNYKTKTDNSNKESFLPTTVNKSFIKDTARLALQYRALNLLGLVGAGTAGAAGGTTGLKSIISKFKGRKKKKLMLKRDSNRTVGTRLLESTKKLGRGGKGLLLKAKRFIKVGPLGLIIGIIKAVKDALGGFFKSKQWDTNRLAGVIGGLFGGAGKGGLMSAFAGMGKWAAIGAGVGSVVPVVGTIVGGLVGAALGGIMGFIGGEKIAKGFDAIHNFMGGLWSKVLDHLLAPFRLIAQLFGKGEEFDKTVLDIKVKIMSVIQGIGDTIENVLTSVGDFFTGLKPKFLRKKNTADEVDPTPINTNPKPSVFKRLGEWPKDRWGKKEQNTTLSFTEKFNSDVDGLFDKLNKKAPIVTLAESGGIVSGVKLNNESAEAKGGVKKAIKEMSSTIQSSVNNVSNNMSNVGGTSNSYYVNSNIDITRDKSLSSNRW